MNILSHTSILFIVFLFFYEYARIQRLAEMFAEKKAPYRFWLTHNPDEFLHFPDGSVDLMFSGHTHGLVHPSSRSFLPSRSSSPSCPFFYSFFFING